MESSEDMEARLLQLEELLARAVLGDFGRVEVHNNDDLAAVELGVNMVLESLEAEIEKTRQNNRELDEKVHEQREAIRELSTPVLQIWKHVIAMPIIGLVDSQRGAEITERLLSAIAAGGARFAILDVTGVEVVDTGTANHLRKAVEAARLLGTTCILSGIQPDVALTLASLGLDLSTTATKRNLESALVACLQAMAGDSGVEEAGR